jgi:hypothetical protein
MLPSDFGSISEKSVISLTGLRLQMQLLTEGNVSREGRSPVDKVRQMRSDQTDAI